MIPTPKGRRFWVVWLFATKLSPQAESHWGRGSKKLRQFRSVRFNWAKH